MNTQQNLDPQNPDPRQQRMEALLREMKALEQEMTVTEPKAEKSLPPEAYTPGLAEGTIMRDGTIFVGLLYEEGNRPVFSAPEDPPLLLTNKDAKKLVATLQVGDKKDFHIPNDNELKLLFENSDKGSLKGTFNTTSGSFLQQLFTWDTPPTFYGSSSEVMMTGGIFPDFPTSEIWALDFADGKFCPINERIKKSYRFVR